MSRGLQPYVMGPATICDGVCNPRYVYLDNLVPKARVARLRAAYLDFRQTAEPPVEEPATQCDGACNPSVMGAATLGLDA